MSSDNRWTVSYKNVLLSFKILPLDLLTRTKKEPFNWDTLTIYHGNLCFKRASNSSKNLSSKLSMSLIFSLSRFTIVNNCHLKLWFKIGLTKKYPGYNFCLRLQYVLTNLTMSLKNLYETSGLSKDIWTIFFFLETKTSTSIPNSDLKESVRARQKLFIFFLFLVMIYWQVWIIKIYPTFISIKYFNNKIRVNI